MVGRGAAGLAAALVGLIACSAARQPAGAPPAAYRWQLPPGFPAPRVPADNPMTAAGVELGRRLFHDPRLSGDGRLACAGCHRPDLAYTDGRARALGAAGDLHPRSAMSLANVGYNVTLGWDDPGSTRLEDQALVPLLNTLPVEMGVAGREREVLERLRADRGYRRAFRRTFPGDAEPISMTNVTRALASFERTLISGDSAYDRWAFRADGDALDARARAGARLFFSRRLACVTCHAGFNFSGPVDHEGTERPEPLFHNTALYDLDGKGAYPAPNTGTHRLTGRPGDMGRFRAPTLRNIAVTAPYMHDGSIPTLEAVIDHYAAGGRAGGDGALADPLLAGFELSDGDRDDLIAFLHSLTDERFLARR